MAYFAGVGKHILSVSLTYVLVMAVQDCWYEGTITRYHRRKRRHRVEYDDGDHEWINLLDECDRVQVQQEDGLWNMVSPPCLFSLLYSSLFFSLPDSGTCQLLFFFASLIDPLFNPTHYSVHHVPIGGDAERDPQTRGQEAERELPAAGLPGRKPVALLHRRHLERGHVSVQYHR